MPCMRHAMHGKLKRSALGRVFRSRFFHWSAKHSDAIDTMHCAAAADGWLTAVRATGTTEGGRLRRVRATLLERPVR